MYETDQDQVEAMKRWWNQYGNYVIAAVLVFFAAFFGHNYLSSAEVEKRASASNDFLSFTDALTQGEEVDAKFDVLVKQHSDTGYVALAALQMAKSAVESGDLEAGLKALDTVVANTDNHEILLVANYRKARILTAQKQFDAALSIIEANKNSAFESLLLELKGDIQNAQGDIEGARVSWTTAQAFNVEDQINRPYLEYKIQALSN